MVIGIKVMLKKIDPSKQFCIPIGLYIDASETVVYQRYSFQPLIMFPLILTSKARNYPKSSRVIALIPDLEANSSAVKKQNKMGDRYNRGLSMRNYHMCLSVALESLKRVQRNGGFVTHLRLGNDVRKRMITVPVAFILGDAKSQDTLTCRYGPHNTDRMCRACHVSFNKADDTVHQCRWVLHDEFTPTLDLLLDKELPYIPIIANNAMKKAQKKIEKDAYNVLKLNSQHACRNAFQDIDFADFPRGIFGSTPHDMMHCFLEGILKYTTRIFMDTFTDSEKAAIDKFVDYIFHNFCSSENKNMLRKNFNKGMTNMTMITADEEIGMALVLLIIGTMPNGYNILKNRNDNFEKDDEIDDATILEKELIEKNKVINLDIDSDNESNEKNEEDDAMSQNTAEIVENASNGKCNYKNFIHLIEIFLSFHAWYKSNMAFEWNINKEEEMRQSIIVMLNRLKKTFPREEGNGWKLQKFHELLHLPMDVTNFGSPKNFDTGIMENRLIHVGKKMQS